MIAGQTDKESRGAEERERGTDNRKWGHRKTVTINHYAVCKYDAPKDTNSTEIFVIGLKVWSQR